MTLTLAVDAAYPPHLDDLASITAKWSKPVVLGYLGEDGCTPHVWTVGEVETVVNAGYRWFPIWTPPQNAVLGGVTQTRDKLIAVLAARRVPAGTPVFIDIEHSTWALPGIEASALDLRQEIEQAGWPCRLYASPNEWRAEWPDPAPSSPPTSIPGTADGWQYQGGLRLPAGSEVDLSVFHPELFATAATPATPDPVPTSAPAHTQENPMLIAIANTDSSTTNPTNGLPAVRKGDGVVVFDSGRAVPLPTGSDVDPLKAAGAVEVPAGLSGELIHQLLIHGQAR